MREGENIGVHSYFVSLLTHLLFFDEGRRVHWCAQLFCVRSLILLSFVCILVILPPLDSFKTEQKVDTDWRINAFSFVCFWLVSVGGGFSSFQSHNQIRAPFNDVMCKRCCPGQFWVIGRLSVYVWCFKTWLKPVQFVCLFVFVVSFASVWYRWPLKATHWL